jgi:TusA-related sulfurtransferase
LVNKIKPDKILDTLGLFCPEPVFRTRQELDNIEVGKILELIADDPAAEADISSLIKNIGQELLEVTKENGELHFFIKKIK